MPLSSSQLLELFIVLCVADHFRYDLSRFRAISAYAESKGGSVRPDSMPTRLSRVITPVQLLTFFPFPTIYLLSVASNQFQQPPWMLACALPEVVYAVRLEGTLKNTVRVLACVVSFASQRLSDVVFEHLGDQFHLIGRREKQRIVQTGPYAWVRHPLYVWILLQEAFWVFMFWSYIPLFVLTTTATVLVIKIYVEEAAILRDETIGEEYRAYTKKVPARIVPYIW